MPRAHPLRSSRPAPRVAVLALALVVLACGRPAVADDPPFAWPDTRAGEIGRALLAHFGSGSLDDARAFEEQYRAASALATRSVDQRLQSYEQFGSVIGVLTPKRILAEQPHELTLLAHAKNLDGWVRLRLELEPEAPHKLVSMEIRPAADPALADRRYEWKTLDDLVTQVRVDAKVPALAVAVADDTRVLATAADGVRAIDAEVAVRPDDRFHVGSVTKSMTATIVGALVEQGVLAWTTTLAEALPDVDMHESYRAVTLAQLLRHRAGIPQHLTYDDAEMGRLNGLPGTPIEQRAAFVAEVLKQSPIAAPGVAMNYSNAGYSVAGHIAERVAGSSWEKLMAKHVFEPAAMATAGIGWPATASRPDEPRGHYSEDAGPRPQGLDEYALGGFMGPAGNVHCSAADLARYGQMHLKGLRGADGALRAATIAALHAPPPSADATTGTTDEEGYACGWVVQKLDDGRIAHWHNGSAGTFYALLAIHPQRNLVIAAVMNRMDGGLDPIMETMGKAILERWPGPDPAP